MKLKNYIFKSFSEEHVKLGACLGLSILVSTLIYACSPSSTTTAVPEELRPNLNVMIPKGYVLYPFEADNFESVKPLLGAYSMVQVYHSKTGKLIAQNIKVLRAPKDPSHLAFLVPVSIASKLVPFGLEFKVAVQKHVNKPPTWVLKDINHKPQAVKKLITFGG